MPRDVMPVMTDRDLSQAMAPQSQMPEVLAQPELDFSRQVIQSMVEGRGRTEPEAITLAGLYGWPGMPHQPGLDMGMIDINPYPGHPSGGFFRASARETQIGEGLDPTTALHEIAGHGGLSELKQTGELGFDLSGERKRNPHMVPEIAGGGALERRLAAAMPGTFSNPQFATDEEVRESLGLQPGEPLPFERSAEFEEQMPTAEDWYDMMQRQNWERDPLTNEWINKGMPRRAMEEPAYIDPDTGQVVKGTQQGHAVFGQNPFTDEHGAVDALASAFGPGVLLGGDLPPSRQLEMARERLDFYEGRPHQIIEELTKWRNRMKDGTREPNYIKGGGWFDETWTDEDIQNYATEASIRMAPERSFFSGDLSEEMIRAIEEQVGGSEAHKKRLEYYKRDLGI